jgi:hypothetical protein
MIPKYERASYAGDVMFAGFTAFTWFHTIISLVMLVAGFVMMIGLFKSERRPGWTALFLVTGVLTSATGFGFTPVFPLQPSHQVGIISLVLLALAILGLYVFRLAGAWRWIYVVTAMLAFYLDAFVFVVQIFRKVPGLGGEGSPGFAAAQGILLVVFGWLTWRAVRKFHPA